MARIRSIKPEFPQSESIGRLSRDARLLFIMLWTVADDAGRLRGAPRLLAGQLFPFDVDAADKMEIWLSELVGERLIERYEVDGNSYIQIGKWDKHQKIDRPGESKLPANPGDSMKTREDSRVPIEDSRAFIESPMLDLGSRILDLGSNTHTHTARETPEAGEDPELAEAVDLGQPALVTVHGQRLPRQVTDPPELAAAWVRWLEYVWARDGRINPVSAESWFREGHRRGAVVTMSAIERSIDRGAERGLYWEELPTHARGQPSVTAEPKRRERIKYIPKELRK